MDIQTTPVLKDSASVSTPGEFPPLVITLGAATAALPISSKTCVVRGWYCNETLGAFPVYLVDATGRKYKIPAGLTAGTTTFVGDVTMTSLSLDHSASATGEIVLSLKVL